MVIPTEITVEGHSVMLKEIRLIRPWEQLNIVERNIVTVTFVGGSASYFFIMKSQLQDQQAQ